VRHLRPANHSLDLMPGRAFSSMNRPATYSLTADCPRRTIADGLLRTTRDRSHRSAGFSANSWRRPDNAIDAPTATTAAATVSPTDMAARNGLISLITNS
jgi:hypothetical protein